MLVKKKFVLDNNSWLVNYVVEYLKSIKHKDVDLWSALENYFASFGDDCEYLYDALGKPTLYPILEYHDDKKMVVITGFEFVSEELLKLRMFNFLKKEYVPIKLNRIEDHHIYEHAFHLNQQKDSDSFEEPQPIVATEQEYITEEDCGCHEPKKRGFFAFLARLFSSKKTENHVHETKHDEIQTMVKEEDEKPLSVSSYDPLNLLNDKEFEKYFQLLAQINDINEFEARDLLYRSNFERWFGRHAFVNTIQKAHELDLEHQVIKLDLQMLFDANFFKIEENQPFKKVLPFDLIVDLEFSLTDEDVEIPQHLEEEQIIKLAA